MQLPPVFLFFFFNDTATTEIYTLSLHDALPIWASVQRNHAPLIAGVVGVEKDGLLGRLHDLVRRSQARHARRLARSEEHTSELQSPCNLVCRLLLEKKKKSLHCEPRLPAALQAP